MGKSALSQLAPRRRQARLAFLRLMGLCVLVVLSIALSGRARADGLTASQIQEKIIGHTWAWTSKTFETSGTSTYYRDGSLVTKIDGWDQPEHGRWQIKEDQLCSTLTGNSENCSKSITQIDDRTFFWEASQATFVLKE